MPRKPSSTVFVAMAVLFLSAGCGEDVPKVETAPPQKVAAPPVQVRPEQAPPTAAGGDAPVRYVYDPSGRRDPFVPLTTIKKTHDLQDVQLTPLQKFDLGQLRLLGIIVGKGAPRAMVSAPDGKSYILKKGIQVGRNEGVVVDITPEAVLVEERYYDFSGEIRKSTQSIELPKREGVE